MSGSALLVCLLSLAQADSAREVAGGVDGLFAAHWRQANVAAAENSRDDEFLRRVTLDLAGRVPTPGEIKAFSADRAADKRSLAIRRLIDSPEFALHFGAVLDEIIQGQHAGDAGFVSYLRLSVAANKPWDAMYREMMIGPWDDGERKAASGFLQRRVRSLDDMANDTASVFFGVNVSCAKCHDHPLVDDWKQDHFYGMASFFNRTYEDKKRKRLGEKSSGQVQFVDTKGKRHTAQIMFLDGSVIQPDKRSEDPRLRDRLNALKKQKKYVPPAFSPRGELVDVALRQRRFFSRAIVNRLWAYYFGRGLVHPVDQMHSENPPSVPDVLEYLSQDLAEHGYDLRRLVGGMVNSRVYQLSSRWTSSGEAPRDIHFARAQVRPLTPMQYATSILLVTGESKLDELTDAKERERFRLSLEKRAAALTPLLDEPEEDFQSSVGEALYMSNNPAVQKLTEAQGGNLVARLKETKPVMKMARRAIQAVLGREAGDDELQYLARWAAARPDEEQTRRDLVWALIASAEFRFNH